MNRIEQAAKLIADIDPALSSAFLANPFRRHDLVTVFHQSLMNSRYSHLADGIAVFCRSAIDAQC